MMSISKRVGVSAIGTAFLMLASSVQAGPIFLTGHDPDFHSQSSAGAQNLLRTGLQWATNNTYNTGKKFLWVESFLSPTSGHLVGEQGLTTLGLTLGTNFDWVDGAGFATADLSNYDAIAIASSFGAMLTQTELDALIARSADIKTFVNDGNGLLALSECFPGSSFCLADTLGPSPSPFGYLPITVSSVGTLQGYTPTAFGTSLGLTAADLNDPTHNSFGLTGALNVVDIDSAGTPTTLAGNVKIDDNGFHPVPEPGSVTLFGVGIAALIGRVRRRTQVDD